MNYLDGIQQVKQQAAQLQRKNKYIKQVITVYQPAMIAHALYEALNWEQKGKGEIE